jgi:hypothetical protein
MPFGAETLLFAILHDAALANAIMTPRRAATRNQRQETKKQR